MKITTSMRRALETMAVASPDYPVMLSNRHGASYVPHGSAYALEKLGLCGITFDRLFYPRATITEEGRAVLK